MPKKKNIEALKADSEIVKMLNKNISLSYLLLSKANEYIEEIDEALRMYGVCVGGMRHHIKAISENFESLDAHLRQFVTNGEDFITDYEELERYLDHYLQIKEGEQA